MTLALGTKLGPYEIVAPLGAGGMGEVYRARDTRLDREVAVKVLPEEMARNADARARFEREAKAVAALSHPNILAVYDVGREQDVSYVVTELLDGETLRERLQGQALPARKALEIGIAVSDGLAAAHAKGIVHRDLKPENIFITNDGVVKILDFGLARWDPPGASAEQAAYTPTITLHTSPGTVLGTVNYMAPEQIRGQRTDARSDIFAFGCVLYEMVTGQRAFRGETSADTMTAILREVPQTVRSVRSDAGPELERVIDRCLDKKAEHRFQSSQDLAFTLRAILADSGSMAVVSGRPRLWAFAVPVGTAAVLLLTAAVFLLVRGWPSSQPFDAGPIHSLAVLPFDSAGNTQNAQFLSEGIAESVINSLVNVEDLRVVPRATAFRQVGREDELESVADELGVRAIVTGRVTQQDDRLVVSAELVDVLQDQQLWGHRYDANRTNILEIERDLARQISDALRLTLTGADVARRDKQYTNDPEARIAYIEGRYWWNKRTGEAFERALQKFKEAITLDPNYALAHVALADTYILMGFYSHDPRDVFPLAEQSIARAIAIDPSLTEVHLSKAGLNFFYKWDWAEAERGAKETVELNPRSAQAYHWYGVILAALGRSDESQRLLEKAREIDPGYFIAQVDLAAPYVIRGDFETAAAITKRVVDMDPNFARARERLAMCYMGAGRHEDAIREARKAAELSARTGRFATALAKTLAAAGEHEAALREIERVKEASADSYVPPLSYAGAYALLGDKETAFAYLQQAFEERDAAMGLLRVDFEFAGLHGDPRFSDVLRRVGLPVEGLESDTDRGLQPLDDDKAEADQVSLAVLPFRDLSPEPQEWFCETMTDAVNFDLGQISGLSVVPNPSVRRYKNSTESIAAMGAALDVSHLVLGSVIRDSKQVQIRVRMFDAATEQQIWAQRFDRPSGDYLGIQGEVARAIASAVRVSLTPEDEERLSPPPTVDSRAYENYMLGMSFVRQRTRKSLETAIKHFDDAIARDPDFALGYAGRAAAYEALGNDFDAPQDAMPHVKEAAEKALALDPDCVEAQTELGYYNLEFKWNWEAARQDFERAVALDPTHAKARIGLAMYLAAMNRTDEALGQLDMAREQDEAVRLVDSNYGFIPFMARQYDRTIREAQAALDVDPNWWAAHMWIGLAYSLNGDHKKAVQHMRTLMHLTGGPGFRAMAGGVMAVAGGEKNREEAWSIYQELKAKEPQEYVCPYELATIPIGLGNKDLAFEEMGRACQARADCLAWLQVDPRVDPIRDDPRFDTLLRRVGFEPKGALRAEKAPGRESIPRLVVLPFENLSNDPRQEYFSDGMTEEMITVLGRVGAKQLGVIARTSAMRFKDREAPIRTIAEELNVGYVVEGSVRRQGNRVRISAKLIDASDETQIWANSFNGTLDDIFALQSQVANEIASALTVKLLPQSTTPGRDHTPDARAYDEYLVGRSWDHEGTEKGWKNAIAHYEKAVEIDPDYALAYASLSQSYSTLASWTTVSPTEPLAKAKAAMETAFQLDPDLPDAHVAQAYYLLLGGWEWGKLDEAFQRAIAMGPINPGMAYHWYGHYLTFAGRDEEAIAAFKAALQNDPLSALHHACLGSAQIASGDLDGADRSIRRALELNPKLPVAHNWLGLLRERQGRLDEAVAVWEEGARLSAGNTLLIGALGYGYGRTGRIEKARDVLKELQSGLGSAEGYVSELNMARVYAGLGDADGAFEQLEIAYDKREPWILALRLGPGFDTISDDPRFGNLLRRIGVESGGAHEAGHSDAKPANSKPVTLAVLPFSNDSGDGELDYLSDGITESLINSFARLDRLRVIPRSTVFRHYSPDKDPIAIAKGLSATALLTGRVVKRAEQVTVQADLIDVTENRQLWGERYERQFADLVEIERGIARKITDALQLRLTGEEQSKLSRGGTQDAEAYRLFLRGRYFWNKRTVADLRRAITYFKEAIDRDPNFAQAWVGLADAHLMLPFYSSIPSKEEAPKAREAAETALRLDEDLAEAHTTLAFALALYDWDWSGSDREFRRALELNPKYTHALKWYTEILSLMGRQDEAMDTIARAAKLDPLSPNIQTIWGLQLWIVGRDAEALARFDKALELDPDFPLALMHKSWLCWTTDDVEGFFATRQRLGKMSAVADVPVSELRRAYATGGREAVARMVLASEEAGRSPVVRARWHASLGELDAAFDDLEQALKERAVWLPFTVHYHLRELRRDPRYDVLRGQLNLPETD